MMNYELRIMKNIGKAAKKNAGFTLRFAKQCGEDPFAYRLLSLGRRPFYP